LEGGDKAKVVIFFKGREIVHRTGGEKLLKRVAEAMEDFGIIEQNAKQEGRTLTMILVPKGNNKKETKSSQSSKI
jgi:translation initiation factor IF-3